MIQKLKSKLEKQIELQRDKIDKLLELLTENIIDKSTFTERKIAIDKKIEKLENDLIHIRLEEDKQNINNGIEKLKKDKVHSCSKATATHYEAGSNVRKAIEDIGGTMPEEIGFGESKEAQPCNCIVGLLC